MAQGDDGVEGLPSRTRHGTRLSWLAPTPKIGHPPPRRPGESRFDSPVFVAPGAPTAVRGGWWVWVDEGGPRGQAHAARGVQRVVGVATDVAGEEMGGDAPPPPPEMRMKMFELAQTNLFTPERKRGGGAPTGDSSPTAVRCWAWGGWSTRRGPGPRRRPRRR